MNEQNSNFTGGSAVVDTPGSLGCGIKAVKWFFIIVGVIAMIVVGLIALSSEDSPFVGNEDYIRMVKDCYVEALGCTYGEVLGGAKNGKWSYFETEDGRQIVELNAENNGENACIQFQLTKQEGNSYWIEPVYSDINGVSIDPTLFFAALIS